MLAGLLCHSAVRMPRYFELFQIQTGVMLQLKSVDVTTLVTVV
jgi:hypothetical protein